VIARQVFGIEFLSAVLARMIVAQKYIAPRKLHLGVVAPHKGKEPDNGRLPYRDRNTPDFAVIFPEDFDFAQVNQCDRFLPG
jgi:hypothetical protein